MKTFEAAFDLLADSLPKLKENGLRIRFVGDTSKLSPALQSRMRSMEEATREGSRGIIALAMPYGGRDDILQAVNALIDEGTSSITAEDLERHLWTAGIPEPDLIIRPGGEKRLSNFLTWQSAYSELVFIDTLWPDFSRADLESAFGEYAARERRRGK